MEPRLGTDCEENNMTQTMSRSWSYLFCWRRCFFKGEGIGLVAKGSSAWIPRHRKVWRDSDEQSALPRQLHLRCPWARHLSDWGAHWQTAEDWRCSRSSELLHEKCGSVCAQSAFPGLIKVKKQSSAKVEERTSTLSKLQGLPAVCPQGCVLFSRTNKGNITEVGILQMNTKLL